MIVRIIVNDSDAGWADENGPLGEYFIETNNLSEVSEKLADLQERLDNRNEDEEAEEITYNDVENFIFKNFTRVKFAETIEILW